MTVRYFPNPPEGIDQGSPDAVGWRREVAHELNIDEHIEVTTVDPAADELLIFSAVNNNSRKIKLNKCGGTSGGGGIGTVTSVSETLSGDDTETISGVPITASGTIARTAVDAGSDKLVFWDDSAGKKVYASLAGSLSISGTTIQDYKWLQFAITDQTTVITTGTAVFTDRWPACTILEIRGSVNTVSSSGVVTIDINESGTSILSTKLTIDASEKTSTTAATPVVISDTSIADDAEMTFDIDTAGTGAKGVVVSVKVRWA